MTAIKGGDILIRAAAYVARLLAKPVRLAFAGNGPAEESWRTLAREQNVDAVFHGWVAGDARTALLRSASLIAVPSLWPEPFGLVGLEAAVHGVPAVGFDVGGIGEWLRDDVNGRLVPEVGSSSALGSAIGRMLTSTSELVRLGDGAVRVASELTLDAHLATVEGGPHPRGGNAGRGVHLMPTFHLLTGEYPPHTGGVGDYTSLVAEGLAARGATVHVWCPNASESSSSPGSVHVHRLPDVFGPASRKHLESAFLASPGCVLLEYVPNALGARGANVPFCLWLMGVRRRGADVRVMFHEPYFYFSWHRPWRNGLALVQRLMAALLIRASGVAYISTTAWTDLSSSAGAVRADRIADTGDHRNRVIA